MKNRRIYRFPIRVCDETQAVQWRKGGIIVHVDSKSGVAYDEESKTSVMFVDFWVMFDDTENEFETRHFVTIPTGKPIPDDAEFVGTILAKNDDIFGGALVFHVFEKKL